MESIVNHVFPQEILKAVNAYTDNELLKTYVFTSKQATPCIIGNSGIGNSILLRKTTDILKILKIETVWNITTSSPNVLESFCTANDSIIGALGIGLQMPESPASIGSTSVPLIYAGFNNYHGYHKLEFEQGLKINGQALTVATSLIINGLFAGTEFFQTTYIITCQF